MNDICTKFIELGLDYSENKKYDASIIYFKKCLIVCKSSFYRYFCLKQLIDLYSIVKKFTEMTTTIDTIINEYINLLSYTEIEAFIQKFNYYNDKLSLIKLKQKLIETQKEDYCWNIYYKDLMYKINQALKFM